MACYGGGAPLEEVRVTPWRLEARAIHPLAVVSARALIGILGDKQLIPSDDLVNAAAGALILCVPIIPITPEGFARGVISFGRPDMEEHRTIWTHLHH
jgi:hypothetical protein